MQLQQRRVNERFRRYLLHHGLANTLFHLAYRLTNSAVMLMIFKVVVLARGDMNWSLIVDWDGRWGFLSHDDLRHFARSDPSLDLDDAFLAEAFARGDCCYGFVEDGILGAYAWYATRPTPIQNGLVATFHPDYIYMHKAFTAPGFRGRRLYGIGITRAMQALVQDTTCKGLISCVQAHNCPSQKGLERIGFMTIGRMVVVGGRRPFLSISSPGCRALFRARIQFSEPPD